MAVRRWEVLPTLAFLPRGCVCCDGSKFASESLVVVDCWEWLRGGDGHRRLSGSLLLTLPVKKNVYYSNFIR